MPTVFQHFGLREQPFGITPSPRFFFPSPQHREALATLSYAIESEMGFSSLIAPPGMGKTTLLFSLLEQCQKTHRSALLFNTQGCDPRSLLRYILRELQCTADSHDVVELHDLLKQTLVDSVYAGLGVLIVVDEAQNLEAAALETLRLLSNFETPSRKLIHIVLSGQPQLGDELAKPAMRQLMQRIMSRARILPLTLEQTAAYVEHRLKIAGGSRRLFSPEAVREIWSRTMGVPRQINVFGFHALSLAFTLQQEQIGIEIIREITHDLDLYSVASECAAAPSALSSRDVWPVAVEGTPEMSVTDWFAPPPHSTLAAPAAAAVRTAARPGASIAGAATSAQIAVDRYSECREKTPDRAAPLRPPITFNNEKPAAGEMAVRPGSSVWLRYAGGAVVLVLTALIASWWTEVRISGSIRDIAAKSPVSAATTGVVEVSATRPTNESPKTRTGPDHRTRRTQPPETVQSNPSQTPRAASPSAHAVVSRSNIKIVKPMRVSQASISGPEVAAPNHAEIPNVSSRQIAAVFPAEPPQPTLSISDEYIESPILLTRVEPVYPNQARQRGVEGVVVVRGVIGEDGMLHAMRAVEGNGLLATAALDALRGWRYQPAQKGGRPIEQITDISFSFSLK